MNGVISRLVSRLGTYSSLYVSFKKALNEKDRNPLKGFNKGRIASRMDTRVVIPIKVYWCNCGGAQLFESPAAFGGHAIIL